jgi:hypothetical protein
MSNELQIFKNTCSICDKNTFTFEGTISTCLNCNAEIIEKIKIDNPVEKVKPISLVITESFGELSPNTYSPNDILHIGISNSKGIIYNFWNSYDKSDSSKGIWKHVVNISIDDLKMSAEDFDTVLEQDLRNQMKHYPKYHQIDNNCYNYICRLFNSIKYAGITWSKENLAITIIEPKIIHLERYCQIYKKLLKDDVLIEDSAPVQYTYSSCDICGQMIMVGQRYRCSECQDYDQCEECFNTIGHNHNMIKL